MNSEQQKTLALGEGLLSGSDLVCFDRYIYFVSRSTQGQTIFVTTRKFILSCTLVFVFVLPRRTLLRFLLIFNFYVKIENRI